MLQKPYTIAIVPSVSREPTDEQMTWMIRRLKMLAKCAVSYGMEGDCIHVLVYPMKRQPRMPHWAEHWRRPEHCKIDELAQVHVWRSNPDPVVLELVAADVDEVWCLNDPGHGQMSPCPQARVWRAGQQRPQVAARFKLVPSWAISDAPEVAKKEKSNAKGNVPRSPVPAREAGGGRAAKGSFGKWGTHRGYPWRDS